MLENFRAEDALLVRQQALPAYNIQNAVDSEHALIVTHAVVRDASDLSTVRARAGGRGNLGTEISW
jgi:hypothetical protein